MRERGDLTLVVLHDGFATFEHKRRLPIENLDKRTRNLIDTGLVDIIRHAYNYAPHAEFQAIIDQFDGRFDLVFMRADNWEQFPGRATLEQSHIPIETVPYTAGISSTKLWQD